MPSPKARKANAIVDSAGIQPPMSHELKAEPSSARHVISNAADLRSVEYLKNEQRLTTRLAAMEQDAAVADS